MRTSNYYEGFDKLFYSLVKFLGNFNKSQILQNHASKELASLFYANLISNFFRNLNQKNVKEYDLPDGLIEKIRKNYASVTKDVKIVLSAKSTKIDEKYYSDFKSELKNRFPEFLRLLEEIERRFDIGNAKKYIREREKAIKKTGKSSPNLQDVFNTLALEMHLQKKDRFPTKAEISKVTKKTLTDGFIRKITEPVIRGLEKGAEEILSQEKSRRIAFESRLYQRWKTPFDLLECMIKVAIETGDKKKKDLAKTTNNTNNSKRSAIIQLHARAIQVANEILTLLKGGYADGANSRWRSLHELAVISFFLRNNANEISQRYLEHDIMKKFKEALDYQRFHNQLGYPPLERKELNRLKKKHDELIQEYGPEFEYRIGYEWVPVTLIDPQANPKKRGVSFRALEEHVKLTKWYPFYSLSSNAIHGGSRGFYRLGLMKQNEVLLVGPSNYGLADPLQNTSISLWHVSVCLLNIEPTFEDIIAMRVMENYAKQIGPAAVKIQKDIEKEEKHSRSLTKLQRL